MVVEAASMRSAQTAAGSSAGAASFPARIRIGGDVVPVEARVPLTPGARLTLRVESVGAEIVLRIIALANAKTAQGASQAIPEGYAAELAQALVEVQAVLARLQATSGLSRETLALLHNLADLSVNLAEWNVPPAAPKAAGSPAPTTLPPEIARALAQVQAALLRNEQTGAIPAGSAETLGKLAELLADRNLLAGAITGQTRAALLASNQPVEVALARLAANSESAVLGLVRLPADIKVIIAGALRIDGGPAGGENGQAPSAAAVGLEAGSATRQSVTPSSSDIQAGASRAFEAVVKALAGAPAGVAPQSPNESAVFGLNPSLRQAVASALIESLPQIMADPLQRSQILQLVENRIAFLLRGVPAGTNPVAVLEGSRAVLTTAFAEALAFRGSAVTPDAAPRPSSFGQNAASSASAAATGASLETDASIRFNPGIAATVAQRLAVAAGVTDAAALLAAIGSPGDGVPQSSWAPILARFLGAVSLPLPAIAAQAPPSATPGPPTQTPFPASVTTPLGTQPPSAFSSAVFPTPVSPPAGPLSFDLANAIAPDVARAIAAAPEATAASLTAVLLAAPRLAAVPSFIAQLRGAAESPIARQWIGERLTGLVQSVFQPPVASVAPLTGLAVPAAADLFMALNSFSQIAEATPSPLVRLLSLAHQPFAGQGKEALAPGNLVARAAELRQAWLTLARESGPVTRAVAEEIQTIVGRGEADLRAMAAGEPSRYAEWLPMLFESRLATAAWPSAFTGLTGWAELLFGIVSRSGLPASPPPPPGIFGAQTAPAIFLPADVAEQLTIAVRALLAYGPRLTPVAARRLLGPLAPALRQWEPELAAELARQSGEARAALTQLTQRFAGLVDQIDAQRLANVRSFESGQPVTFWLPIVMGGHQTHARIDYAAEFGGRRKGRRSGSYNVILSVDMTHTGPLQFRLHVWRRAISLEVASANARLLALAESMRDEMRTNLARHGFHLERFAVSEVLVEAESWAGLSPGVGGAGSLSINA